MSPRESCPLAPTYIGVAGCTAHHRSPQTTRLAQPSPSWLRPSWLAPALPASALPGLPRSPCLRSPCLHSPCLHSDRPATGAALTCARQGGALLPMGVGIYRLGRQRREGGGGESSNTRPPPGICARLTPPLDSRAPRPPPSQVFSTSTLSLESIWRYEGNPTSSSNSHDSQVGKPPPCVEHTQPRSSYDLAREVRDCSQR